MLGRYSCSLKYAQLSFRAANLALIWCIRHMTSSHLWSRQSNDKSEAHRLSMSVDSIMGVKPVKFPSVRPSVRVSVCAVSNQIKSNEGFVVRSIQRNRSLLCITTIKYKKIKSRVI